eukprot:TRINITY_DN94_c0_g3_i1.p1 TRINITY_DN94_c0_g3~~TRINITY_DN94_c0_g3_i1.p1  ORF type:complete len:108 (-),score=12.62 TRINITY_DN94_c0_g3_i1:440-763(-)
MRDTQRNARSILTSMFKTSLKMMEEIEVSVEELLELDQVVLKLWEEAVLAKTKHQTLIFNQNRTTNEIVLEDFTPRSSNVEVVAGVRLNFKGVIEEPPLFTEFGDES